MVPVSIFIRKREKKGKNEQKRGLFVTIRSDPFRFRFRRYNSSSVNPATKRAVNNPFG